MYLTVVVCGMGECLTSPLLALLCGGVWSLSERFEELVVLCCVGYDGDVAVVFGSCADEGDSADVDFFDDLVVRGFLCYGLCEWVQVDDDQVEWVYVVLLAVLLVRGVVLAGEYGAEDCRVQGFDATAEDRGVRGELFDGGAFVTPLSNCLLCASGGYDLCAGFGEEVDDLSQFLVFVVH